jgi:L-methionine (R)-S-oxide reductase
MYRYAVPKLGEGGACSIFDEFENEPYDLANILGGSNPTNDELLLRLNALIQSTQQLCGAGWIGIYQARKNVAGEDVLVKLAYRGKPSRAEFPLTKEFAEGSTNSQVGLSGKAVVINDVAAWQAKGEAFYVCDPAVQSEACVPILSADGKVIGIIDAEAQPLAHFSAQHLAPIIAAALVAGKF